MPSRRPEPPPSAQLELATLREVLRILDERLHQLDVYGAGGCPTCHDAELRGTVARLRALCSKPQ